MDWNDAPGLVNRRHVAWLTEVLPLVEFFLEEGITDDEALHLLDSEPPRKKEKDDWKEMQMGSILGLTGILENWSFGNWNR